MKPSVALDLHREQVRALVARRKTANPRVFGSVSRGEDEEGSDIDILVDRLPRTNLFDLGGLQADLEDLLGVRVDLLTPDELPEAIRTKVIASARAI